MGKKKSEFVRATRNKKADEALIKGMSMLDFTKNISLTPDGKVEDFSDLTEEQREQYVAIKKHIRMHLEKSLKNAGVSRWASNFGSKHPMNVLLNADAHYLSKSAVKILDDDESLASAIGAFENMFGPFEIGEYCKKMGKNLGDLSEAEEEELSKQITTPILQVVMREMLIGQQVDKVFRNAYTDLTPEDFGKKWTFDHSNFQKSWYAPNTQKVTSFVSMDSGSREAHEEFGVGVENTGIDSIMYGEFKERLDADDVRILRMREEGYNQVDIAKELGCTQGTISKRLRSIQKQWKEFNKD